MKLNKEYKLKNILSKKVIVSSNSGNYNIYIGNGILEKAHVILSNALNQRQVILIFDNNISDKVNSLKKSLEKSTPRISIVPIHSGETSKSLKSFSLILEKILSIGIDRNTLVIAFGGGVVGDIAGFVSSVLLRGIDFIQIPTTLLAQVDSSVGGKTGINSQYGKNLIGTFHQPIAVLSDLETLNTLDKRQIKAGYAEIIKYGLIFDPIFFQWLEKNGLNVINGNLEKRSYAIIQSCKIKSTIVKNDEFEKGQRSLLNLGHTFAHSFESMSGYQNSILHGEAVSVGIILAFKLAVKMNICKKVDLDRVTQHFIRLNLPSSIKQFKNKNYTIKEIWETMQRDKKSSNGNVNFVLPKTIGKAVLIKNVDKEIVLNLLKEEI